MRGGNKRCRWRVPPPLTLTLSPQGGGERGRGVAAEGRVLELPTGEAAAAAPVAEGVGDRGKKRTCPLPLSTVTQATGAALRDASGYLADLVTPTVRLGVTGLARSGKTVFIAALVRNLTLGGRLPFFSVASEGRLIRAYLEPQPDDAIPRFAYEDHLAALARDPPTWPESTRRISQLRVTIEYTSASRIRRTLTPGRLHLDIVDYPGEWLVDLPMMAQSYAEWSAEALALASAPRHATPARGVASVRARPRRGDRAGRAGRDHRRETVHRLPRCCPRCRSDAVDHRARSIPAPG